MEKSWLSTKGSYFSDFQLNTEESTLSFSSALVRPSAPFTFRYTWEIAQDKASYHDTVASDPGPQASTYRDANVPLRGTGRDQEGDDCEQQKKPER